MFLIWSMLLGTLLEENEIVNIDENMLYFSFLTGF